jgi:uncharacterized repeat protein (TIGR01451 family)
LSAGASYPAITVNASVSPSAPSSVTNTATVSGGGEVNLSNDSASNLTYIVAASTGTANLSITTTATSGTWVYAGNNLTFVHTITNSGPAVSDITFTEAVPAYSTFQYVTVPAGWTCTTPAVGATGTVSCTNPSVAVNSPITITVAFNTNSTTTNGTYITATASVAAATTYDPNLANNTASVTTLVNTGVNLTVTNTGTPSPVLTGGKITYTQTVVNNGPSAAPTVVFTEVIPPNGDPATSTFSSMGALPAGWSCSSIPTSGKAGTITCSVSSMAPGNTAIFTVVLNATGAGGTVVTDVASAYPTPTTLETSPGDNSATSTINVDAANTADLGVAISGPANPIVAGTNITYTYTVTNYGPAIVTNATLTGATPANTTLVSYTAPTGWTCTTSCSLNSGNTLAVNATAIFTMVVTVTITDTPGTTVTPSATVSTTMTDPNSANNTATLTNTVGAQADLAITNTSTPPTLTPSNNITYTQQLTNNGPNTITANTANGVTYTVTIQIPTNTNFQSITVPRHWTCVPPAVGTVGPTTFPCTLSSGSSLASNASVTFSPVLQVSATAANGTIISETASVASCSSAACSDPVSTNNSATVSNTVVTSTTEADLVVTNTPSVTSVSAGEPITYTQVLTNNGPANASTVTFTEAIPTNTNFQAITATGWTCTTPAVGATGTVTCKIATLNNAAAETFLLTVQVNAGTAAGTIITDAASATATTTDPNSSNNTNITATTTVAATGNADMSVSMTGTPSTVNQGDTLTYTISVSNNGPNQATNVTLTDALPSGVTYASVSTTAGTCSQASGTVTCLLGTMSNGGSATVTLLASAGSSATITNTASVTAAQNDPNLSNNSSSVTTTIATPTAVKLRWFKAVYSGSDVILQWKTGGEAHNLGFNVYREQNGERVRINPSLVAGSALRMHDTSSAHSAKTYAWMDHPPANASGVYWLEDVDLNGVRTFHGPSYVQAESGVQVVSRARMITELRTTNTSLGAAASRGLTGSSFNPAPSTTEQQQIQFALAAGPAMKIQVRQEGWYQITQAQVAAAGLNVAQLGGARLYAEGVEQPIRVSGAAAGGGMRSELEFYGTGIDTVSSNARVYWLVVNGGSGKRIHQLSGAGGGGARPQSFPYTVELKDRTTYFAALPTSDGNNFFGALVTTTPVDQVLAVQDVVTAAAEPVQLEVALQGVVADVAHDVQVSLNGVTVGDITYNGQNQGTLNIEVPVNLLVAGNNTVTLTAQDGDNDISLVGHITLTYPHSYTAQSDYLKFSAVSGDHIKVQGFTQAPSRLLDITDPANPVEVMARVVAQTAGFALDFSVPAELSGTRTFLAVADDAMASPVALVYNQPSNWHASQAGAQVVMISDPAFASQLTPLVSLRQSQGWSVAVVLTDDIFDEFNFGERSPQAIRDFLQNSTTQWQTQPQYVLLVGDASVDPNNYLGFGYFDFVPTKIIATSELMTACDDWFTEFGNDGIAQIPTGRLPVSTADQATLVVGKIVGYETNATFAPWMNAALLVADQDDTESFTKDTLSVAALLPQSMQLTEVMASTMDPGTASQQILAAINSGKLLVNYLGHGSEGQWSGEDLFDDDAAASLTNSNQLSVFLLMDCLNGFFHDVYAESLATALLFSPNGGAVAVWASSGLVNPAPEVQMDQQLISALVANPGVALGDAVQQGKMNITDPGARQTYILFGDPLLHMKSMSAATVPARQPHRPVPVRQPLQ